MLAGCMLAGKAVLGSCWPSSTLQCLPFVLRVGLAAETHLVQADLHSGQTLERPPLPENPFKRPGPGAQLRCIHDCALLLGSQRAHCWTLQVLMRCKEN